MTAALPKEEAPRCPDCKRPFSGYGALRPVRPDGYCSQEFECKSIALRLERAAP